MICSSWSSFKWTQSFFCPQFTRCTSLVLMLAVSIFLGSRAGYAEIDDVATNEYIEFLARINDYSPLEHGGSHGTIGFGVGIGLAGYEAPKNRDVMREHWRGANQSVTQSGASAATNVIVPRLQIHKGLPGSFDIGGGLGSDRASGASLVSAYTQWTIYEGFAMPAFAVRGGYNRVLGLATTDASSTTVAGVASFGFLRIFTIYGTMGAGRHQIEVRSGAGFGSTMALNGEYESTVSRAIVRRSNAAGIKVQIIPALCDLSFESKRTAGSAETYLAKVSLGM
jgi:hypothetical protein